MAISGTLIIANPGTGKTTSLAEKVVELLKSGAREEEILCITFTIKAAEEMRQRITDKIDEAGLKGIRPYKIGVHTFHSFTYDYLVKTKGEHEVISDNPMRYAVFKSLQKNKAFNYSQEYVASELVPKIVNAVRYLKSFSIMPENVDSKRTAEQLQLIYETEKMSNVSYEELIMLLGYFLQAFKDYEAFKPPKHIDYADMLLNFIKSYDKSYKHFKYVLVDELQDVNELEARIAIESGDELFLVGDRKQAIFGFQGGSIGNFRKFESLPGIKRVTKGENYRSSQAILDYAKTHFLSNTSDKSYGEELSLLKSSKNIQGEVSLIIARDPIKAAVKKLMMIPNGEKCAIITRTNDQIVHVSEMLDSKGVDYSTTVSSSVSEKAKETIVTFLKGLLYDDDESVINALFTPFSGVILKEAFSISERYHAKKLTDEQLKREAAPFFRYKEAAVTFPAIYDLFDRIIMPISVSIGKDYHATASAMLKNIKEAFDVLEKPERDDFFTYLSMTDENYEIAEKEKDIVLTTVHKSKGLEFDNVIYIPKKISETLSAIDAIVYAIIKSVNGVDVREELMEEHLRVDFVSFTRAKKGLYICTNNDLENRYLIGNLISREVMDEEAEVAPISKKYDEAYSLFVHKRYEEAKMALEKKDTWVMDALSAYLSKIDKLSYSLVEEIVSDPFGLFKKRILHMPEISEAAELGTGVHRIAEKMFKKELDEESIDSESMRFLENIKEIDRQLLAKGTKEIAAEKEIELQMNSVFPSLSSNMSFLAKIDAIYESEDGKRFVLLDYKTDKTEDRVSNHRRQLAVYRRIFSADAGVNEKDVDIAVGFVGLRGNINTGKLGLRLDMNEPKPMQIRTFEEHAKKALEIIKDPYLFVKLLKEKKVKGELLYNRIVEQL